LKLTSKVRYATIKLKLERAEKMSSVAITEKAANISPAADLLAASENLRQMRALVVESGDYMTDEEINAEIKAAREERAAKRSQRELFTRLRNEIIGDLDFITVEELDAEVKALRQEMPNLSPEENFDSLRAEIVENGEFMTLEEINAEIKAVRRGER